MADPRPRADLLRRVFRHTSLRMEIGDVVTYEGRAHVLRGLDPMSVDDRRALIEACDSGERFWVPVGDVHDGPPRESAA